MKAYGARFWFLLAGSALLGAFLVWQLTGPRSSPPLTETSLASARALWSRAALSDYAMTVLIRGKEPHRHEIEVHAGTVTQMLTDGAPAPERVRKYWSMEAIFQVLEEDLANARRPQAAFGVDDPRSVFLDATFDGVTGIPLRYLRQVSGRPLTVEWEIRDFRRL
jgi:hypothetical protein